jgi:23S rRNA (uracil1939-C5)-methyltransferase
MSRRKKKKDIYALDTVLEVDVLRLDGQAAAIGVGPDGRELRVVGGVPGDHVRVRVTGRGRRDIWTELIRVLRRGNGRVDAPCLILSRCGTCSWQSIRYRDQLLAKGDHLRTAIHAQEGLESVEVTDPENLGRAVGYRTKIQMPAGPSEFGISFGFYAPRSHKWIAAHDCIVQHPLGEEMRHAVAEVLRRHRVMHYTHATENGHVRTILIRVAEGTGQVAVVLVVPSLDCFNWASLVPELESIRGLRGLWLNVNPTDGNAVLGETTVHLAGAKTLMDEIGGVKLQRSPIGFFQTNHRAIEALISKVGGLLPESIPVFWDLYSGSGLFTAALADRIDSAVLVESNEAAAEAARKTVANVDVKADVHCGLVEAVLPELKPTEPADAAIVDPPRTGLTEGAIAAIVAAAPRLLVYVSCRQKSLLRDLSALRAGGYTVEQVVTVDMFPHTPHLESVTLLRFTGIADVVPDASPVTASEVVDGGASEVVSEAGSDPEPTVVSEVGSGEESIVAPEAGSDEEPTVVPVAPAAAPSNVVSNTVSEVVPGEQPVDET